jgi:hypothetical protein
MTRSILALALSATAAIAAGPAMAQRPPCDHPQQNNTSLEAFLLFL